MLKNSAQLGDLHEWKVYALDSLGSTRTSECASVRYTLHVTHPYTQIATVLPTEL